MNTGIIASRYADALLKFVIENGHEDQVYQQIKEVLTHPEIKPKSLEPDLESFLLLLIKRGRMDYVRHIFIAFIDKYYKHKNIKPAYLTTAVDIPELDEKLRNLVRSKTGSEIILKKTIRPDLIGGFVFEIGGYRMDASLERQLTLIKKELIKKSSRIV